MASRVPRRQAGTLVFLLIGFEFHEVRKSKSENFWSLVSPAKCNLDLGTNTFNTPKSSSHLRTLEGFLRRVFTVFIRPRLEYANLIWSGGNITKLLKLEEKFCKGNRLTLPTLNACLVYHTLLLFFKIRQNTTTSHLSTTLPKVLTSQQHILLEKSTASFLCCAKLPG